MAQSVPTARIGSFRFFSARAILAQCLGTAHPCASAPPAANCRPTYMSCPVPGRALAVPSNMMSRRGVSSTTGPHACRSWMPKSTYSTHGSATFSTNCSGRRDDVRSLLT